MTTTSPQDIVLEKATREKLMTRTIISGATGSGKTCTGLRFCNALVNRYGGKIGVIDTQNRQSLDYAQTEFDPHGFYPIHLQTGRPEAYINALGIFAKTGGFTVVFIDSLTDAWQGEGGVLEQAGDKAEFQDWGPAKKGNYRLLQTIQRAPFHIIATVLADTQYLIATEARDGKDRMKSVSVVGTKPIQDKKTMPKFPLQLAMDEYHRMTVVRTSFPPMDRAIVERPGEDFWTPYLEWLDKGKAPEKIEGITVKAASLAQLSEYYELQASRGLTKEKVVEAFYRKYGSKPDDCTEDFLQERLEEIRPKGRLVHRLPQVGSGTALTASNSEGTGLVAGAPATGEPNVTGNGEGIGEGAGGNSPATDSTAGTEGRRVRR